MKTITLDEVVNKSTEDGVVIYKYKKLAGLRKAASLLTDQEVVSKEITSFIDMGNDKVYYVQDYSKHAFYYQCNEFLFEKIKDTVDDDTDSLINLITGLVEVYKIKTNQMKTSAEMRESFKSKINSKEIKITEI